MKRFLNLLSMVIIMVFILAACGGEDNQDNAGKNESDNNSVSANESNDAAYEENEAISQFEEVESFELEGAVTNISFSMNEEGDVAYWGENTGGFGDEIRRNVWVDGEVKELDIDVYNLFSFLTPAGKIISKESGREAPGGRNKIIEYDPKTDEVEKIASDIEDINTLLPGSGTYMQDPNIYVHVETNPNLDESRTMYWDVEKNEISNLSFLQDIKDEVGEEISSYVHYFLNSDGSVVYGTLVNVGVFSHDVESGETERLLETDNIMPRGKYTNMLTTDDKHLIYGTEDLDASKVTIINHALDVETQETIEIGDGTGVFTLSDGNVIIVDENDVNLYDFEKDTLETIHTIILEENQEIDNVTMSIDGSTIAYGYRTKNEGDEETTYHMSIWSNK